MEYFWRNLDFGSNHSVQLVRDCEIIDLLTNSLFLYIVLNNA